MKKSGANIFIAAMVISAGIHLAAYCSMNIYMGWKDRYNQAIVSKDKDSLFEIGMVNISQSSPSQAPGTVPIDRPETRKVADKDPEIATTQIVPKKEINYDRKPDLNVQITATGEICPACPMGRAGISRSTAGMLSDRYLDAVRQRIAQAIFYPRRARLRHLEGEVKVSFMIKADGDLDAFKLVESSPHRIFNLTARSIMEKAAPFPPPGPDIIGKEIVVPIKFDSTY